MTPKNILTILLAVSVFLQSPMTVAEEAPEPWASSDLQARLTTTAHPAERRTDTAGLDPMIPVMRFYQQVGHLPVWFDEHGLSPQGETLLDLIAKSADDGLSPEAYLPPSVGDPWRNSMAVSAATHFCDPGRCTQVDVALTDGALRYARHLSQGSLTPDSLHTRWLSRRMPSDRDIPAELALALKEDRLRTYIESLHPKGHAYRRLSDVLRQYEQIRHSGGWPTIAPGPTLQRGDRGDRIEALKHRLSMTGDWSAAEPADQTGYDETLEAAVKRFQRRHGLRADGLVGNRTRSELNTPVEDRIRQLQLNLERWRWLPDHFGDRYLLVNIPAFELSVVEAGSRIESIRAIVGRKRRQTPIMSGRMTYLELNPFWNIPQKIAREDILPKVIGDPAYLNRQGIRVFDSWDHQAREIDPTGITWERLSAGDFPYRLKQDPSGVNALGRIKFMFPNPQSVYIHDTPDKSLFNRQVRIFSSGCVRLETPLTLAQYLLENQGWDHARLNAAIASGQRQTVVLENPIPVYLVYFTAWVDADGTVNFREDVYGQDRDLLIALKKGKPDLMFCSDDALVSNLLAACTPVSADADEKVATAGHVAAPIESTLKNAENSVSGI